MNTPHHPVPGRGITARLRMAILGCALLAATDLCGNPPSTAPNNTAPANTARLRRALERVTPRAVAMALDDMAAAWPGRYDPTPGRTALRTLEQHGPAWREALQRGDATNAPAAASEAQLTLDALRMALLANPLLEADRVLLLKRAFPTPDSARHAMGNEAGLGSLNAHTSDTIPRTGRWRDALVEWSNLRGTPRERTIYAPDTGDTLIDPDLDFDSTHILFAQNGASERNWRIIEIGVDGTGRRQITPDDGADVGHFDPCYLPDGRILFASTAVYQGLPCEFGGRNMVCLYLLDRSGGTIRQLTFEQDSDWCPTVLPNGRVLYQRWEYSDLPHSNSRRLFHMNPDGTDQRAYYGSNSYFPNSFFYARPIPGGDGRVIGVAGGHHGTPRSGRLLILDPARGRQDADGVVQEIPGHGRAVPRVIRDRLVDGVWPQFLMPYPLSDTYHLVVAKPAPDDLWGLYLADTFDNLTLIGETEGAALLEPIPLRPTPRPPTPPDRIDAARDTATVQLTDVHRGPGLAGVPRGTVSALRVVAYYFSFRGTGGLLGSIGMDGPWDIKRILGTVPVEPDGSAFFTIPANTPLMVQPVDEHGQALALMRSWFVGMPGENLSCVGCHEYPDEVPPSTRALAVRRPPSPIAPWYGPARGFSFEREVQPVLDHHCAACHDGTVPTRPYLTGDRRVTDWRSDISGNAGAHGGRFSVAYADLHRFVRRPGIESDIRLLSPLDYHFSATELGQLLHKGHHGVTLDPEGWERLAAWADLNAPFHGTWGAIVGPERVAPVAARALELRRRYVPMGPFHDYERTPEAPRYTHAEPSVPPPAAPLSWLGEGAATESWPFSADDAARRQAASAPTNTAARLVIPLARNLSLARGLSLAWIPPGEFVMGSLAGHNDERPAALVRIEKGFWMSRHEISNAQLREFDPAHDSRDESRHGYQFGRLGYDLNGDDQPAVRVAWEQAMAYCAWLSQRTGRRITLPTEAQWEWACRAGSDQPFWFGGMEADYAPCANLGDRRLAEFAACTARDNYAAAAVIPNPTRYDDWVPRDDRVDDGTFVSAPVGRYRPNPWGLHDMHGNVWEWTRSRYRPYPYRDHDGRTLDPAPAAPRTEVVARGGSWYDRPFRCTSSYRLAYQPFQRVFNVGFRVIVEE